LFISPYKKAFKTPPTRIQLGCLVKNYTSDPRLRTVAFGDFWLPICFWYCRVVVFHKTAWMVCVVVLYKKAEKWVKLKNIEGNSLCG
jgi:hypothetical protein